MTALVIAMFWAMTVQAQESQDSIESVNKAAIEREQNDARISSAEREQAQQEVKLVALQEVVIKGGLPNTRLKVNGQKTLGENVSDNGGLKIAYRAYKNRMASEPLGDVDGFTPDQRFYLAYARVWACNSTPEYTAMLVNSDVHSPARLRVMAALPMIDTWYEAFGILPTDKMFIPKEKRALVW